MFLPHPNHLRLGYTLTTPHEDKASTESLTLQQGTHANLESMEMVNKSAWKARLVATIKSKGLGNPLTSEAYERVVLSEFYSTLFVWNSHGQVLRLKWDLSVGSWSMGDELFWWEERAWMIFGSFRGIKQLKEVMHKKVPCFIFRNRPLTNQIHLESEWNACVIH